MRIVIVGGVAAGMSAAARARRHDESAEIIVLERGPEVSFANCGLPYHVGGEIPHEGSLLLHTPETLRASLNLDVRTGHDVTAIDTAAKAVTVASTSGVEDLSYDALILAPGAVAIRPPLPGLDSPRVRTLRTVADAVTLKKWVDDGATRGVVLGAGFIGLEAAEALRHRGLEVDVVELAPHVLPPLEREMASVVTTQLRNLGIRVHAGVAAESVEVGDDEDVVVLADGTRIPTDLVVLSVGVRPDTAFVETAGIETARGAIVVDDRGRTSAEGVWAAGDAVISTDAVTGVQRPVPLAGPANRAGRLIADDIFGMAGGRPIPQPVGTAIVRVGEITAAMTGANRASLDAAGIDYTTIHLHPMQHAGYFPGASTVHLIVHVSTDDGRVLGAQAVGYEGVDKRIDVLATAIRAGLPATDLMDLDLAYSPPYGQAKDAVNLVGMVAENVENGRLKLWYADELDQMRESALILDVRTPREYSSGHIEGSLNIPHTELRERIDEVREAAQGRPIAALCAAGVRSNIAYRILVGNGFDAFSLSGGTQTLRQWWGDQAASILVREEVHA
ncbi:MAG: pyridine nucleotide-disulfide oxidoreductase [Actinobacteria bacterium]|uniref:FAD-dependent oxidoreductase n=1 Tax=Microbacterium TaxID=33882 RepID=UPI000C376985|nr:MULTISPECIES: FAD-dependent oxidoreductase [Microbacterium]RUA26752.1 MAG: pyridine nucleotide-disulfide oxidoreductase [Actinomycetota bacterium]MBU20378.1 pyridine nucleotide-disulfide oxidoreductase [Microbacterium sp.]MCC4266489.1 FAD-dependent oxidoreductase [Microbacterium schleiferi]HAJ18198.1 pyridine nucleotide-disulfide oxidoreductase [Microbacterium sp.]HAM13839.1 pyridine nucleotide-disulfide oxidoreductase [Microbacterium sp.]|tara:strand:+ start:60 stop:1745 length:1686 start_codon:yes stop_codon:yes gene_type:complete